jgi:uncharacterized protein YdhG (YjbR/CyaY superfamily)
VRNSDNIDDYIANFPDKVQKILVKIRETIHKITPSATEVISYGIPTFKLNGKNLVHFGGFRDHVSFFPTSSPIPVFKKELTEYKVTKGTIQFPLEDEVPYDLIARITKFRVKEVARVKL